MGEFFEKFFQRERNPRTHYQSKCDGHRPRRQSLVQHLPVVKGPKQIVLFLNNRCNAACEHCFIPDLNSKTQEVALPHWLDLLKTLPGPYSLTLTGGETMLTEGLEDFIRAVFEQTNCDYVGVLTNGSLPEATFKLAVNLTREFPTRKFKVQLSLDGTEVRHNLIRKNRHSYSLALKTASLLQQIRAKNFSYVFLSTLTRNNHDDLLVLIEELQRLGHQSKLTLVRGNSFSTFKVPAALLKDGYDPQEKNLSLTPDEIKFLLNKIESKFPNYFYGQQKEKLLLQASTLEAKRRLTPCYAGSDEVVLYSDGKVGLCEQILPFATIKDFKLGLSPLWNSAAAHFQRAGTRDCACIHGCNLSTSLRRAK